MGAGSSSTKGISYKGLLQATNRDQILLTLILKTFVDTFTKEDLRALTNPQKCKKYVFMMSGALQTTFKKLQIMPQKGPSGVIFFTKLEDLEKRDTGDFVKNCFYVAYYYIRILQIFCALSLSMSMSDFYPMQQGQLFAPFQQMGGSDEIFNIFRQYGFIRESDRVNKYQFKNYRNMYYYSDDDRIELTIDLNTIVCNCRFSNSKNSLVLYDIYYNNRLIKKDDTVSISNRMDNDIYKKLNGLYENYRNKPFRPPIPAEMRKPQKPGEGASDTFTRFAFINDIYVRKLSGHQSMPYAVSRAFQLIDGSQMIPVSNVGNFMHNNIIENVPYLTGKIGDVKSLQNVLGLSALEKLYYDNIYGISATDNQILPSNEEEYYSFLKKMKCIYEDSSLDTTYKTYISDKKKAIDSGIVMFRIKNLLTKDNVSIPIDRKDKRYEVLLKIQQRLFGHQMTHTKNTMAFIQKSLIQITPTGIFLNPLIQRNGFQYINWLGEQSRKILLEYYVTAESIYNEGVNIVLGKPAGISLVEKCRSL